MQEEPLDPEPLLRPSKFSWECSRVHPECGARFVGARESVIVQAAAHVKKAHGARDEDEALRRRLGAAIREEAFEWYLPRTDFGEGGWPARDL